MDTSFTEAWIHRSTPHRVLGRKLRPFCLWHLLLLQQINSPLLGGGERTITPVDLSRAVAICRCRYGQTNLSGVDGIRAMWALFRRGLAKELEAFRRFVGDYQSPPEYQIIPAEHGASRCADRGQPPELLRIVADVIAVAHCSRQEAWEMPEGEARWWYAMALRNKGVDLDFMTPEERTRQRSVQEEDPELDAQMREAAEQLRARRNQSSSPEEDHV